MYVDEGLLPIRSIWRGWSASQSEQPPSYRDGGFQGRRSSDQFMRCRTETIKCSLCSVTGTFRGVSERILIPIHWSPESQTEWSGIPAVSRYLEIGGMDSECTSIPIWFEIDCAETEAVEHCIGVIHLEVLWVDRESANDQVDAVQDLYGPRTFLALSFESLASKSGNNDGPMKAIK